MATYIDTFQEDEFERGPWLEILDEEGKPMKIWKCARCGYLNFLHQETCGQDENLGCGAVKTAEIDIIEVPDDGPRWAHGTPETNPYYPHEGPAMGWVHA